MLGPGGVVPGNENMTDVERMLLGAAFTADVVNLQVGDAEEDDPANGANWGSARTVRAGFLAELVTGERTPDGRSIRGLKLRGARIIGRLDLEASAIVCPLFLRDCHIEEPVDLSAAIAPAVYMPGCVLPELIADQLQTDRNLELNHGFVAHGEVSLSEAHIGGQLNLIKARLSNDKGRALTAHGLTVDQDVFLGGLMAEGEVRFTDARIGRGLELDGATLSNPAGYALFAKGLNVEMSMSCADGFSAQGEVRLAGARIGGQLVFDAASLTNSGARALFAERLTVGQDMSCSRGFSTQGEVRLPGAHVGGQLSLAGASLSNPAGVALLANSLTVDHDAYFGDGITVDGGIALADARIGGNLVLREASLINPGRAALYADRLTVDQDMRCGEGFSAQGEVRLPGAHIGGQLTFAGAILTNPEGTALYADQLTVGLNLKCGTGFSAQGEVRLPGAHIGGQLTFAGATFTNPEGTALTADGLTVGLDVQCRDRFSAQGEVRLPGAHIGMNLSLNEGRLANLGKTALLADKLTVGQDMFCADGFTATGEIRLLGASIGASLDLANAKLTNPPGLALGLEEACIKTLRLPRQRPDGEIDLTNAKVGILADDPGSWPAVLHLRGFSYDSFENQNVSTHVRLKWLKRHPGRFTPQVYDQLAAAYQRAGDEPAARKVAVAKQWHRRRAFNPLNLLWYITVGYGYRTWLAGIWLVGLVALGTWIFREAYPAHMMAISSNAPPFHAPVYALDILLPVIGLGEKTAWQPRGSVYLYWSWALTVAGWVLATAVVAGLTGILKRD